MKRIRRRPTAAKAKNKETLKALIRVAKHKPNHHPKKKGKRKRWDAILDRLPTGKSLLGVEIGVLNGRTSCILLKERPLLEHHMIDPWLVPTKGSSYDMAQDINSQKSQDDHNKALILTKKRVAFAGKRGVIKRMMSHEAINDYKDHSLDFVFIDGDHSYDGVKKDIEMWECKVKSGGWIGGHDFLHPKLPGVAKAVFEKYDEKTIELDDNRTWFKRIF